MVRKTKEEATLTKERIIRAAEECFCEYGVYLSSFDMVAKKALCTRGAIYWHFRDKNELLFQVTQSFRWPLISELKSIISGCEHVLEALVTVFKECIHDLRTDSKVKHYLKLMIYRCDEAETYLPLKHSISQFMIEFELLLKKTLSMAKKQGEITGGKDPTIITNVLIYSFYGAVRKYFILESSEVPLIEFIEILDRILGSFAASN